MSVLSKTGLVPTPKKLSLEYNEKRKKRFESFVLSKNIAKPVEFSVRPFGGLYNPYSKSCSVLCNHPAPSAVRNVIKKVKDSWSSEGKSFYGSHKDKFESAQFDKSGHIPEELFRRYTDTDSRPLTPSPATTSIRTRTSAGSFLNTRRCVTPEPGKENINKRKKLILDLRRSHSQETVYWKASSEVSQGLQGESQLTITTIPEKYTTESAKTEQNKKKNQQSTVIVSEEPPPLENAITPTCINEKDVSEEEAMQRRGKKRKKSKHQPIAPTFHLSQDPETQIATLGPDSLNPSTRPSLIPNASTLLSTSENKNSSLPTILKDSFLTDEAFRVLKTELDYDVIENTFERYLNRALREAIKYVTPKEKSVPDKTTSPDVLKDLFFQTNRDMPRKLSKSAARFEMPLNIKFMEIISVYEYLSEFVWISRQRKQLYKKTFLKYISKEEFDEAGDPLPNNVERRIPVMSFRKAVQEVLGFYSTEEIIDKLCDIVEIDKYSELNFRSWCGILAFAERLALKDFQDTDSCDELEKSDFDSLEQRLSVLNLSPNMKSVLEIIRKGHLGRI